MVLAIGVGESCALATPSRPTRLIRPTVGLSAATPMTPAGRIALAENSDEDDDELRLLPFVVPVIGPFCCVWRPIVAAARPDDRADAEPADEPAGVLSVS